MNLQKIRNELDDLLDDYEYLNEKHKLFNKLHLNYIMMRDLLLEMKDFNAIEGYDVGDIFKRIEELDDLGL